MNIRATRPLLKEREKKGREMDGGKEKDARFVSSANFLSKLTLLNNGIFLCISSSFDLFLWLKFCLCTFSPLHCLFFFFFTFVDTLDVSSMCFGRSGTFARSQTGQREDSCFTAREIGRGDRYTPRLSSFFSFFRPPHPTGNVSISRTSPQEEKEKNKVSIAPRRR